MFSFPFIYVLCRAVSSSKLRFCTRSTKQNAEMLDMMLPIPSMTKLSSTARGEFGKSLGQAVVSRSLLQKVLVNDTCVFFNLNRAAVFEMLISALLRTSCPHTCDKRDDSQQGVAAVFSCTTQVDVVAARPASVRLPRVKLMCASSNDKAHELEALRNLMVADHAASLLQFHGVSVSMCCSLLHEDV